MIVDQAAINAGLDFRRYRLFHSRIYSASGAYAGNAINLTTITAKFDTRRIVCRSNVARHAAARPFRRLAVPLLIALGR